MAARYTDELTRATTGNARTDFSGMLSGALRHRVQEREVRSVTPRKRVCCGLPLTGKWQNVDGVPLLPGLRPNSEGCATAP